MKQLRGTAQTVREESELRDPTARMRENIFVDVQQFLHERGADGRITSGVLSLVANCGREQAAPAKSEEKKP